MGYGQAVRHGILAPASQVRPLLPQYHEFVRKKVILCSKTQKTCSYLKFALVAELADAPVLGSGVEMTCGFKSCREHHYYKECGSAWHKNRGAGRCCLCGKALKASRNFSAHHSDIRNNFPTCRLHKKGWKSFLCRLKLLNSRNNQIAVKGSGTRPIKV